MMLNPEQTLVLPLSRSDWQEVSKRILDVCLGVLLLALATPILALATLCIKLEDRGPIFYRSARIGLNGVHFYAWKLRTMRRNADRWLVEHPEVADEYYRGVKLPYDPRVTRIGRYLRRYSLDEVPQLVNVLKGEMSLVGPRIILPLELPKLGDFAAMRLSVPPGLTGLWQVSGRCLLSYEERLRLDREYIERWSIGLDLMILMRTVPAVLSGRGAT